MLLLLLGAMIMTFGSGVFTALHFAERVLDPRPNWTSLAIAGCLLTTAAAVVVWVA